MEKIALIHYPMELFTLGVGNSTEKDVKESARAFTGWSHNFVGEFKLRKNSHDEGEKVFLKKKGPWDSDDVLDIVLEQPTCAQFMSKKICHFFVNDTVH